LYVKRLNRWEFVTELLLLQAPQFNRPPVLGSRPWSHPACGRYVEDTHRLLSLLSKSLGQLTAQIEILVLVLIEINGLGHGAASRRAVSQFNNFSETPKWRV
jgi:hypothetical protein